jgi:hypothetical protein
LRATVTDVRIVGAFVKIEVAGGDGQRLQVELGRGQYDGLRVTFGERLYVKPERVRVFTSD